MRWLTLLVGLGSIYAGIDYVRGAEGDELGQALLILLPFGLAMVVIALAPPSRPGDTEGVTVEGGATVLRMTRSRSLGALAGLAGFTCVGLGMALFPGDSPDTDTGFLRVFGTLVALGFGALLAMAIAAALRGGGAVVLTPGAITQRWRIRSTHVEWSEITGVDRHQWRGAVHTRLNLAGRGDVLIPLQLLPVDPDTFQALVEHMYEHPEDRPELAGPEVLRRLAPPAAGP
jgi:hypothetical protein